MKKILLLFVAVLLGNVVSAQVVDFTGIEINTESRYYKKEKKPLTFYAMIGMDVPVSQLRSSENEKKTRIDAGVAPALTLGFMGKKYGFYATGSFISNVTTEFFNIGIGSLIAFQEDKKAVLLAGIGVYDYILNDENYYQYSLNSSPVVEGGYMRSHNNLVYGGKVMICLTHFAIAPCLFVGLNFGK